MVRKNYIIALEQLDYVLKLTNDISNDDIFKRIYFNKALIYITMEKYDKAPKYLKILTDKFELRENELLDIKMLYANCLIEQNKLEDAENEYIEILDPAARINDKNLLAMTYRNLSEVYLKQKKIKDAKIAIKKSLKNNHGNSYLVENLHFASTVFKSINTVDAETYLLRALKVCEKNKGDDVDTVKKIIYDLMLIYMEREDEGNIIAITQKAEELNINCNSIYAELIKYYRYRNEENSKYFNDKLIKALI
jgi:tetratricopeptide (TPR) repeat protein